MLRAPQFQGIAHSPHRWRIYDRSIGGFSNARASHAASAVGADVFRRFFHCFLFRFRGDKIAEIVEYCDTDLEERVLGPYDDAVKQLAAAE
jgi:ketosteroid isomerase-like protein